MRILKTIALRCAFEDPLPSLCELQSNLLNIKWRAITDRTNYSCDCLSGVNPTQWVVYVIMCADNPWDKQCMNNENISRYEFH